MLTGAGLARACPHDRAHAFFSRTRWNVDSLGIVLAHLIVRTLLPQGAPITVAVDDTLFKRSGKKVFGAAWQHDGAARGPKPVGRGTCFVAVGIVVELPFLTRPACLGGGTCVMRPPSLSGRVGAMSVIYPNIAPRASLHHRAHDRHRIIGAAHPGARPPGPEDTGTAGARVWSTTAAAHSARAVEFPTTDVSGGVHSRE
ncbi:transposase [Streptomyces mirabilis]